MKILVTGATGFIGYEVSTQLSSMGFNPRLMIRRGERGNLLDKLDAETVDCDLTDRSSLTVAVKGVEAVIHLGARATFEKYDRIKDLNVTGSFNLINECLKNGIRNFVFGSSMFVYSGGNGEIDQNTLPAPLIDYGRAKLEVEEKLIQISMGNEINIAAIRLPHVYGTQNLLFGQIRKGFIICPGNGNNIFTHLHVHDASRVLIQAALKGWHGVSPVGDNEPTTWNDFYDIIKENYSRVRVYRVPKTICYIGSMITGIFYDLFDMPNIYTEDTVTGFNLNLSVKAGALWNELGILPDFPTIREGIPEVLNGNVPYRWKHPIKDK